LHREENMSRIRHNPYLWKRRAGRRNRKGFVASLELLLVLPIMLLILLAVIQFGLFLSGLQQLYMASRVGGLEAARTADLASFNTVPPNVMEIIQKQLDTAGIELEQVRLEHNLNGGSTVLVAPGDTDDCGPPREVGPNPPREYVRVTVCVKLTEVMPNGLAALGFGLADNQVAKTSVLYRYDEAL
jgi:hypothetical protein